MSQISLSNDQIEITFDSEDGYLTQILNKRNRIEYLKFPSDRIFYLWFLQKGKKSNVYANDDEPVKVAFPGRQTLLDVRMIEDNGISCIEIHHVIQSAEVTCRFSLWPNSELLRCEIEVNNASSSECSEDIVGVGFPHLIGIVVGEEHANDILVRPNRFGEKIPNPVGKAGTYHKSILYGGFASMMWMDIYDEDAGLYIASYDNDLILTALESIPDCETATMTLGMRKYAYIPVGNSWKSNVFVIGAHQGDWHWAADRYREWAESWMKKPVVPERVKWSDGWLGINFKDAGHIKLRFEDIEDLFDDARYLGLDHIQFWGQMVGDGCCYRFYYPDPRLGTIDELKRSIASIKRKGGYIGFYFNIQAFSPYTKEYLEKKGIDIPKTEEIPDWLEEFRDYAQINFDGSATVQYPGREFENDGFRIMCTYSDGWQRYLLHWVIERYLKELGANFAYIDQAFSPPVSYCFNFAHGHKHHGCSAQGRGRLIKRIIEEARKYDRDFSLCIEGNGDSIGQFCDLHLYTSFSSQTRYPSPEVFAYTFPNYIIIDGFANPPVEWIGRCYYPDLEGQVELEDLMNRVYLFGFRFDVTPLLAGTRLRRGEPLTEHIRKLIALRKKVKKFQYESRFMDDLGIKGLPHKVLAKGFKGSDGQSALINLLDYRPDRCPFIIEVESSIYGLGGTIRARLYGLEGQEMDLLTEQSVGATLIRVPTLNGKVASLVLQSSY